MHMGLVAMIEDVVTRAGAAPGKPGSELSSKPHRVDLEGQRRL
jgi:hypothetical protein